MSTPEQHSVSTAIVKLMQGVVYREAQGDVWRSLERHEAQIQDHFATIGVRVVIDPVEGYAFLKTLDGGEGEDQLPRLVKRRSLTYPVSLLLLLLRKRLAEFEAGGDEGKLVLERDQISEMLRLFLRDSTNETRVLKQVDQTIAKVAELGFLHRLRGGQQRSAWEVKRIIKAYVDAETMADFASQLKTYAQALNDDEGGSGTAGADPRSHADAAADAAAAVETEHEDD